MGWSFSHYSLALQCLRKYKYVVIDKLTEPGPASIDLDFGTALHAAIHSVLEGEDGVQLFEVYWDSFKDKDFAKGRFGWAELRELGIKFAARFERKYAHKFKPILMEKRLYASYKDVEFEGTPDFVGHYEAVPTLFDWKTTGYPYHKDKALVALQLHLYAYLYSQQPDAVKIEQVAYLPFVKGTGGIQNPIIIPLDEAKMRVMLDEMVEYIRKVDGQTHPRNLNACIMGTNVCKFKNVCFPEEGNVK